MTNGRKVVGGSGPWPRPALAIVLAAFTGGCPPKPPKVTAIEIVPSAVEVGSDPTITTTFELEARLWTGDAIDRHSIIEGQGYDNLAWKVAGNPPWLTVTSPPGFRARFSVGPALTAATSAQVTVKAGGKTSVPVTVSVKPSLSGGGDALKAKYTADKAPDVVFVNGVRNAAGASCDLTMSPFVSRSMLGNVVGPCTGPGVVWGAAVMAVDQGVMFTPVAWTPGQQTEDAAAKQGPERSLPLALRVMVGVGPGETSDEVKRADSVLAAAEADVKVANSILADARVGVQLAIDNSTKVPVSGKMVIGDCLDGDAKTSASDKAGILNVYYVNSLSAFRGRTCGWREGRTYDVIYVGWEGHSPTTLVHEVGHALGLTLPGEGHTDNFAGFDATNVMMGYDDDLEPGGRRRLSVGQVFRMNADSASWLTWTFDAFNNPAQVSWAPGVACRCGEEVPKRCPRLADDIAPPSERPDGINSWECFDRLKLGVPGTENPVAVVAGRPGRAPPGTCKADIPGHTEKHFSAVYVRFDNLTRPGLCDSWAVLFFEQLGVVFLPLTEPTLTLSPSADPLVMAGTVPDPVQVTVHVYYSTTDQSIVDEELEHAQGTFGESNRSGIRLVLDRNASPSNTTAPCPAQTDLVVCYASPPGSATQEAELSANRIKVWLGRQSPSTVSHFLGEALGLDELAVPGTEFPDNVMHTKSGDRGQKLTLSQVLQINAFLNHSLCAPRLSCPTLGMDVAP